MRQASILCLLLLLRPAASGTAVAAEDRRESHIKCGSYCAYVSIKGLGLSVPSFQEFERQLAGR